MLFIMSPMNVSKQMANMVVAGDNRTKVFDTFMFFLPKIKIQHSTTSKVFKSDNAPRK